MRATRWGLCALLAVVAVVAVPAATADRAGEPHQGSEFKLNPSSLPPEAGDLESSADDRLDPQNQFNEVVSHDTTGGKIGVTFRVLKVPVRTLDNQLEVKYLFTNRTCGGGGPRAILLIDTTGDNDFDVVADGFVGPSPAFTGCPMNRWTYEDLTDEQARWVVRRLGGPPISVPTNTPVPWEVVETALGSFQALYAKFVDDSGGFFPAAQGCAYYDLLSLGAKTLTDHSDTAGQPTVRNTCP